MVNIVQNELKQHSKHHFSNEEEIYISYISEQQVLNN